MKIILKALGRAALLLACCIAASAGSWVHAQNALPPAVNTDPAQSRPVLPEPANAALPTLFLIGDSTVRNGRDDGQGKGAEGQWGWGNPIAAYFDASRINVVNRAIGGLSSRTYISGGHWERTLALLKPGDVVAMQFGHNDASAINDDSRARGTIKGTGEESQEIDNQLTGKRETVRSYGWYLRQYIAAIRAKGATPIVCSPVPRKKWTADGKTGRGRGDYAGWAAEVARQERVGFIDLNELVARKYDELGRDAVMKLFPLVTPDEHTHTNLAGAELNARMAVAGIKALHLPTLTAALSDKAADVAPVEDERPVVDAGKVRADTPRDPALPNIFIVGDSTVRSGGTNGAVGWGEWIAPYFDTTKVNVVNHAIGGRSSRTFYTEGRWDKVLAQMKAGDVVLIQFGHNDGGRIGDPAMKGRASGKGTGPETVDEVKPDGSTEQVRTFGWYMAKYVADARAKGASVVLLSPVPHKDAWEQGRDFASFAQWDAEVAAAGGAQFADLTMVVSDGYKQLGAQAVNGLFSDARTHTNEAGAKFNAQRVVAALNGLAPNPVARYLVGQGRHVPANGTQTCGSWGTPGPLLHADSFNSGLQQWMPEYRSAAGSSVTASQGKLTIDVAGDATVWFKPRLRGDIMISYRRKVVMAGGANDRLSDLNQFWMASDPRNTKLFTRDGTFSQYDALRLYYMGMGGNANTTTRFRKYDGTGQRVLLTDLADAAHLLQPNREYAIQIAVYQGCTRMLVDGVEYFSYRDPDPLQAGHFGFRSTHSRQEISDFKVVQLTPAR